MKKYIGPLLANFIGSLIGVFIGVFIALWFKLPDHKVDVFAFVESSLGIVLTVSSLIITLGIIRIVDELVDRAQSRLERDVFKPFEGKFLNEFILVKQNADAMKSSFDTNHQSFVALIEKIRELEKKIGTGAN